MKIHVALAMTMLAAASVAAPSESGRDAFVKQQAYEDVQRVAGQVDILEQNQNAIADRVAKLEKNSEIAALKAEIAALKSEIASIRKEMQSQRSAIVSDLSSRIDKQEKERRVQAEREAERQRQAERSAGPRGTYTVQAGDTLSLIAQAFNTTVSKLRQMNGLKSDMLRIGQKLTVPADK
ncbi:MAG: LysM peptidoglycan-binding domain-containing protein [Kiritimatiellae bacterium]|nr:LysM peptidoglycan-binding domain-containing protein [Kiritimatiellia bacterium]